MDAGTCLLASPMIVKFNKTASPKSHAVSDELIIVEADSIVLDFLHRLNDFLEIKEMISFAHTKMISSIMFFLTFGFSPPAQTTSTFLPIFSSRKSFTSTISQPMGEVKLIKTSTSLVG